MHLKSNLDLQTILNNCKLIKKLLIDDVKYFNQNDFDALDQSNKKKSELFLEISQVGQQLELDKEIYNKETIKELQNEISQCYSHIITNSNLVYANMQQLKQIWDKLVICKTELEGMYDKSGKQYI